MSKKFSAGLSKKHSMSPEQYFENVFYRQKIEKLGIFFQKFEQKFFNEAVKTSLYAPEEQLVTETLEKKTINK